MSVFSTHLSEKRGLYSSTSMPEAHTEVSGKDRPKETYLHPASEDTPVQAGAEDYHREEEEEEEEEIETRRQLPVRQLFHTT